MLLQGLQQFKGAQQGGAFEPGDCLPMAPTGSVGEPLAKQDKSCGQGQGNAEFHWATPRIGR
ncbi:hypothetical protein D3C86_1968360 [compost metagenome]